MKLLLGAGGFFIGFERASVGSNYMRTNERNITPIKRPVMRVVFESVDVTLSA